MSTRVTLPGSALCWWAMALHHEPTSALRPLPRAAPTTATSAPPRTPKARKPLIAPTAAPKPIRTTRLMTGDHSAVLAVSLNNATAHAPGPPPARPPGAGPPRNPKAPPSASEPAARTAPDDRVERRAQSAAEAIAHEPQQRPENQDSQHDADQPADRHEGP